MSKKIGDLLIEKGVIDQAALRKALALQSRRIGDILVEERLADPVAIAQALQEQAKTTQGSHSVQIDSRLFEEILLRLEGIEDAILASDAHSPIVGAISGLRHHMEQIILGPVEEVFVKAQTLGQTLSQQLCKVVRLECTGGQWQIDRGILKDLWYALLHLIRNAYDHGIQDQGTVKIKFQVIDSVAQLTIHNDGRGIDWDHIYQRAQHLGMVDKPRSQYSQNELQEFLFRPSFTTKKKPTEVSGRGIGLDVVEALVRRRGGLIHVNSQVGQGATFTIRIPAHHMNLSVLPVRVGQQWYALNSRHVLEVKKTLNLMGMQLASVLFDDALKTETLKPPFSSLILSNGTQWVFSEIGSVEQVLVRNISFSVNNVKGLIGSARLKDGKSVLVYNQSIFVEGDEPIEN